jgi:transposase-like protein
VKDTSSFCAFGGICDIPSATRDLEELMAERGLSFDHSTAARWVLRYAPE